MIREEPEEIKKLKELSKKYKGCRCSQYCSVWNSEDGDCEIMGEHHLSPSRCRWFLMQELRKYELNVAKLEIEKLEKENAELRTKTTALENANRAMVKELDDMTSGGVSVLENVVRSKEQLTKAKKIIKNLMVFAEIDSREYEKEYKEADQFLKEVSE